MLMDEGFSPDDERWSSSDSLDDIDSVSLLPDIKRKPDRIRRRKLRFLKNRSVGSSIRRMCSRRTLVYTSITAVLLVSVVLISVFVKPSTSEEFEETKPEKRSDVEKGSKNARKGKLYLDKNGKKFSWQEIRLPTNVVPVKYRVELHPNITTFKFTGTVDILVKCVKNTNEILFHAKHMDLSKIKVVKIKENENLEELKLGEISESDELEMYSIEVKDQLQAGQEYIIYIEFKASLSDKLFGFYKSSYKNKKGETRYLATTHFEPTDARAAFPCFDEPALKAKFEIIIIRDKHYTALSNMPLRKTEPRKDGLLRDHFKETVKMSTYLIAFVVCDFKHLSAKTKSGTLVRVWAPPDDIEQGRFALSEAKKILYYYENFFKVKFPLPKQDLIAIPDFAAGAMENWGLITYRSTSLLYDEKESSDSNKQWVATVVAHELAHQWFGNLVTMKWWNDLWLNEGFASYVENIGSNFTNPEWKMMDQFLLDKTQLSMNLDQMSNSHPISVPVHNPNQINSLFDTISYDKGAAIIRMLKNFIGDEAFKHGLQNYLKAHKFGNAETRDLWSKLSEAARKFGSEETHDVQEVMDTWTLQMGFPVVTIKRENGKASASQKHFLVHPKANVTQESKFGYKWLIPLTYRTQRDNERKQVWMNKNDNKVDFDWPANSGWIKANYGQRGFYRVNYETENWEKLRNQLNTHDKVFNGADKAGLIDDAFNLARAGQLKLTTALDLTLYMVEEKEYVPWSSFLNNMGYIDSMLCNDKIAYALFKKYVLQQLTEIVKHLGWKDTGSHLQKYLRSSVLRLGSEYGHERATYEAKKMFDEWMLYSKPVPPNLRNVVYAIGVREGGKKEFDFVVEKFQGETVATEKRKLMYAMTSTKDHNLINRLLKMSLDTSTIRSQDTVAVITAVSGNCVARQQAWNFLKSNWAELYKRYGTGSFDFSRLILRTSSHFNTENMLKETEAFIKTHDLASAKRAGKQSLESIRANVEWVLKNKEDALKWFKANTKPEQPQKIEEALLGREDISPDEYPNQLGGQERPEYQDERHSARNYYYQPVPEDYQYDDGYFRDAKEVEEENDYGYGRNE